MRNHQSQTWLAQVDCLSKRQRGQACTAFEQRQQTAASLAAIELRVDEQRRCPGCHAPGAVACVRTFNALIDTPPVRAAPQASLAALRPVVDGESDASAACGNGPAPRTRTRCPPPKRGAGTTRHTAIGTSKTGSHANRAHWSGHFENRWPRAGQVDTGVEVYHNWIDFRRDVTCATTAPSELSNATRCSWL